MSLWEFSVCVGAVEQANSPSENKPEPPTPDEFYAAIGRGVH